MGSLNPSHCKIFFRKESTPRGGIPANKGLLPFDWSNQFKEGFDIVEPKMSEEDVYLTGRGRDVSLVQYGGFKVGEGSVSYELLSGILLYYALGGCVTTLVDGYQELNLDTSGAFSLTDGTYYFKISLDGATAVEFSIIASSTATWAAFITLLNAATLGYCSWTDIGDDVRCTSSPISITDGTTGTGLLATLDNYAFEQPAGAVQGMGMSGKDTATDSGLSTTTQYYVKLAVSGAAAVEYSITTAADVTLGGVIDLLNAEMMDVAQWSISGGDLVCTLTNPIRFSSIAITAGTTGTDLLTTLSSTPATAVQGYFLHTITGADSLPTMTQYMEQLFSTPLYTQGKGIIVKSWEITYEVGNDTPIGCNVEIMVPEAATVTALTNPTPANFSKERFTFGNIYTLSLTYNSTEISGDATYGLKRISNKCSFKIENEIDYVSVMGDDYPQRIKIGKRMVTFSTDIEVQNSNYYAISRLRTPNFTTEYGSPGFYAGILAFSSLIKRNNWDHDSVSIAMSHVAMDHESFTNKFPSWEDKVFETEIGWKMAPLCTNTFLVKDDLPKIYYEDD